ncbi:MAG: hypothetical protein LBK66_04535 [Spirochaetaceae bacterium]|nr:hypothetical protein [Spirochaetaceae bacterium]
MPKHFWQRIDLSSPVFTGIAYTLAALIVILIFKLFFPDLSLYGYESSTDVSLSSKPLVLNIFRAGDSLTRALLAFISVFPAVFMSAQVIPFCHTLPQSPHYRRFSLDFFKLMRPQLIMTVTAVIVYSLLSFIVRPIAADYQADIQTESILFAEAEKKAIVYANKEEWTEAYHFLSICDRIWPNNPALNNLRELIGLALSRVMYRRLPAPEKTLNNTIADMQRETIDLQNALRLADTALREGRFYDAHRLAVIAGQLSEEGSNEAVLASRLAGTAWNAIENLEPDAVERGQRAIYQRKKNGYEEMINGNWVNAYYIFRALAADVPDDPDVKKFFALSAEGLSGAAFFIDEMDRRLGAEISNPFFSLPLFETDGRLVMRLASLSSTADYSYGKGLEIAAFDSNQNPLFQVSAPYVKFLPFYIDGKPFTIIYLQAFGRDYEQMRWGPSWEGAPPTDLLTADLLTADTPKTQLALSISYEDFLLSSTANRKLDGFFIRDIWLLAGRLALYGYIPEVYQAEIIYIISEPLFFLPLTIFSLIMGWNLRCKKRSTFMLLPMLIALPFMFNGFMHIFRSVLNMFCVFTLISFGFTPALLINFAAAFLLFALAIVLLTAQHD